MRTAAGNGTNRRLGGGFGVSPGLGGGGMNGYDMNGSMGMMGSMPDSI